MFIISTDILPIWSTLSLHYPLFCLFQIDNQQFSTVFPVALYPSPLPSAIIHRTGKYGCLACHYVILENVYDVRAHRNCDQMRYSSDKWIPWHSSTMRAEYLAKLKCWWVLLFLSLRIFYDLLHCLQFWLWNDVEYLCNTSIKESSSPSRWLFDEVVSPKWLETISSFPCFNFFM